MALPCSFYDLISYQEPLGKSIRLMRKNYGLAYIKWVHCYELFGTLISELNHDLIDEPSFLNCIRELGLFAYEISGSHERDSRESQIFLQQNMDYLYENSILLEMFFPPHKKLPKRPIPRIYPALDFWTDGEMKRVDGDTFRYFESLFPHKQLIRHPSSLSDLPPNINRFYQIMDTYEPISNLDILFNKDFIFSFYLLIWPVLKRTGYAIKNLWSFVYFISECLNRFTMNDYVIVDCNHFYPNDSHDPYYCGRSFTTITAPDILDYKFVIFNTVAPMDMSPFKLSRYKQGLEFSGPPLEVEDWDSYISRWNERYHV